MITSYTMGPRLYFLIHSGRLNRDCFSQLIIRYRTSRHILRSSTFPLCFIYRSSFCYHRRVRPLIPPILRIHTQPNLSKNPLHNYIRRSEYNLLSTALPWSLRNATSLLRLPRCIHNMKHYLLYRILHLAYSSNTYSLHNLRSIRI